jgi:hypothetical protein
MRILLPILLLLAACPEQSGLQCPANTNLIGQYALAFTANHDAGECLADAGPDAGLVPLTFDDAGVKSASLCVGTWPDGGTQLNLMVPGKGSGPRTSDLLPDGGFHFVSGPVVGEGTPCICDVTINETFDGYLFSGSSFELRPDGGLPVVTSLTATLVDRLYDAGSATICQCAFPCTAAYSVHGTPF